MHTQAELNHHKPEPQPENQSAEQKTVTNLAVKTAVILLILVFIQVLNQFLILVAGTLQTSLFSRIPDSNMLIGVVQQLIQAGAAILIYRLLFSQGIQSLGINTANLRESLKFFRAFVLIWLGVILLYVGASYFLLPGLWTSMRSQPLPPNHTILSTLFFELIFPGLGEELLFRGLIIQVLTALIFPRYEENRLSRLGVILFSSAYFAIAHVYFNFSPFRITHIDLQQILTALGCGAFYAVAYLKTKSLLAPFLAHNFANTTSTICGWIIAAL
ncbi:MAG: CPBP family intramembrane metalloprotease [Anaerolineaceae bacterium]|nr:CPBP family intramembrane metalloprotease [Anaerolineaceae bacterium]